MKHLLFAVLFLSCGCSYQYTVEQTQVLARQFELADAHQVQRQRHHRIHSDDPVCFSLSPRLLAEEDFPNIETELATLLKARFAQVEIQPSRDILLDPISQADNVGCGLLLDVSFLQFDDEISSTMEMFTSDDGFPWTGTDKAALKIVAWDIPGKRLLDTAVVYSRTPWAQFGTRHPAQLINDAWAKYLASL